MNAYLRGVEYELPMLERTNEDLVRQNPEWNAEKIFKKTGIRSRRIAAVDETAGDLGGRAAARLLVRLEFDPQCVDALMFCTQSPDYFLPSTACVLQDRLGLPTTCAAFDFDLGCSGFTYGLWLARSLIRSGDASNVLLVVGDTYSRYCPIDDMTTVTIFGDAGAAAMISADDNDPLAQIGPSVVGTDGRGAENLIVRQGAARAPAETAPCLYMNGPEIFSFTMATLKTGIEQLLERTETRADQVDWYLFHQANRFMLEQLRQSMKIPSERMPIDLEDIGNTVSATIPILLHRMLDRGEPAPGDRAVLAGFGVGYSWALTELTFAAGCRPASNQK